MTLGTDSNRECPSCGREIKGGLKSWTGEPPECAICQGQTVIADGCLVPESELSEDEKDRRNYKKIKELLDEYNGLTEESDCIHEALERNRPENQKGGAHMLVCPCPKCSPRC